MLCITSHHSIYPPERAIERGRERDPNSTAAARPTCFQSMADASSDDLDQLLDSALDDFTKLDLTPADRSTGGGGSGSRGGAGGAGTAPPAPPSPSVQGLGMGLPDLKTRRKGKQRAAPPRGSHASEALEQLTRQTREALRGLESAAFAAPPSPAPSMGEAGLDDEAMVENLIKQFGELTGSQDMESVVQTMMQQLLSKEILHEPMKEIGDRYPKWLEEHKDGLNPEDYDKYHHQYELIIKLNEVYEKDPGNFPKIVDLMQKMQECGPPPHDIIQELAPDLDLSLLSGQLTPEFTDSNSNCCIM